MRWQANLILTRSTRRLPTKAGDGAGRNVRRGARRVNQRRRLAVLVLDTDLLTILLRGPASDRARLLARLDDAEDEQVAVTIITFEEQMRGWLAAIAKAKTFEQQSAG